MSISMLHVHLHAAFPFPCCMSMPMLHVHVHAAFPCPCCMSMSMLHVYVHVACSCSFCMTSTCCVLSGYLGKISVKEVSISPAKPAKLALALPFKNSRRFTAGYFYKENCSSETNLAVLKTGDIGSGRFSKARGAAPRHLLPNRREGVKLPGFEEL
jgi:hypothetical protein